MTPFIFNSSELKLKLKTYTSHQPSYKFDKKISLWRGDITKLKVDVIVNSISGDECIWDDDFIVHGPYSAVSDCIYEAGGSALLHDLCQLLKQSQYKAVWTSGHRLPAKCK